MPVDAWAAIAEKIRPLQPCAVHHQTVVIPVDIPSRWEPRAKQQPTGLIAYSADWRRQSRPVRVLYRSALT